MSERPWTIIRYRETGGLALAYAGNVPPDGWDAAGWDTVDGPFTLDEAKAAYERLQAEAS